VLLSNSNFTHTPRSKAITALVHQLAAERGMRLHAEIVLRSEVAALMAERDTLAARVATLERERCHFGELARRAASFAHPLPPAATPAGLAPAPAPSPRTWSQWLAGGASVHPPPQSPSAAAGDGALTAIRHHLITLTTDRDLLAADLYRCLTDKAVAERERDCALAALAEATAQLAPGEV